MPDTPTVGSTAPPLSIKHTIEDLPSGSAFHLSIDTSMTGILCLYTCQHVPWLATVIPPLDQDVLASFGTLSEDLCY
jgi:hypothetical protein